MSEVAGKKAKVFVLVGSVAMTGSTGAEVFSNDVTYSPLVEMLETTKFGDDYKRRMAGLKDVTFSFGGDYDPDNTGGQGALEGHEGDDVYIGYYPAGVGTAGKQFPGIVEKFEIKAAPSGKVTYSCTIAANIGNGLIQTLPIRT